MNFDRIESRTDGSVSEAVVEAIAEAEGIAPMDLTPPLYEAVNPDALDGLFHGARQEGSVSFTYCGYEVTVRGEEISVRPLDDQSGVALDESR